MNIGSLFGHWGWERGMSNGPCPFIEKPAVGVQLAQLIPSTPTSNDACLDQKFSPKFNLKPQGGGDNLKAGPKRQVVVVVAGPARRDDFDATMSSASEMWD